MSATIDALIEKGDEWLGAASKYVPDPDDADRQLEAAMMACAYYLRAGHAARVEAETRARSQAEQFSEAVRARAAATERGGDAT